MHTKTYKMYEHTKTEMYKINKNSYCFKIIQNNC